MKKENKQGYIIRYPLTRVEYEDMLKGYRYLKFNTSEYCFSMCYGYPDEYYLNCEVRFVGPSYDLELVASEPKKLSVEEKQYFKNIFENLISHVDESKFKGCWIYPYSHVSEEERCEYIRKLL